MKLSLSNLAWDIPDNDQILSILNINNVSNVEGVLSKIDDWDKLTNEVLLEYKKIKFSQIIKELAKRQKISGIQEKKSRKKNVRQK